jgi:hypothetical protein
LDGSLSGGLNGIYRINATTVSDDAAAVDELFGEANQDWFLVSALDQLNDQNVGGIETATPI